MASCAKRACQAKHAACAAGLEVYGSMQQLWLSILSAARVPGGCKAGGLRPLPTSAYCIWASLPGIGLKLMALNCCSRALQKAECCFVVSRISAGRTRPIRAQPCRDTSAQACVGYRTGWQLGTLGLVQQQAVCLQQREFVPASCIPTVPLTGGHCSDRSVWADSPLLMLWSEASAIKQKLASINWGPCQAIGSLTASAASTGSGMREL